MDTCYVLLSGLWHIITHEYLFESTWISPRNFFRGTNQLPVVDEPVMWVFHFVFHCVQKALYQGIPVLREAACKHTPTRHLPRDERV